jgi:hypothetical protein
MSPRIVSARRRFDKDGNGCLPGVSDCAAFSISWTGDRDVFKHHPNGISFKRKRLRRSIADWHGCCYRNSVIASRVLVTDVPTKIKHRRQALDLAASTKGNKMPETTTTNSGGATPATETKTKKHRSPINQAHARELAKAEAVAQAASNDERAAQLAARDIDEDYVSAMFTEVGNARDKAAEVVIKNAAQREATAVVTRTESTLIAALQEIQKAAKQKYARTNRVALAAYFVGRKLNGSKPNLAQTSQTILEKLATDKLPGITPAKVKALEAARKAWMDATEAQSASQGAALEVRAEFKTLLKNVSDRRVAVQLAADAEWPHTEDEHNGVRKAFALPSRKPANI